MEVVGEQTDAFSIARRLRIRCGRGEGWALAGNERPQKVIVEHTSINPNKAVHIGHLRNVVRETRWYDRRARRAT